MGDGATRGSATAGIAAGGQPYCACNSLRNDFEQLYLVPPVCNTIIHTFLIIYIIPSPAYILRVRSQHLNLPQSSISPRNRDASPQRNQPKSTDERTGNIRELIVQWHSMRGGTNDVTPAHSQCQRKIKKMARRPINAQG